MTAPMSSPMSSPSSLAATEFGAPIGAYRGGAARIWVALAGVALLALAALFLVALPLSGDSSGDSSGLVSYLIAGAIWLAGAIYCFWTLVSWRGAHAQLFERGFSITRAGKTITGRWDDVASVTQKIFTIRKYGIPLWTSYLYTVTMTNGETARVNNAFGQARKLGDVIQRMSANALLPRAIAAYQSGATLPFGKISLSQAGISNGRETVPWNMVNDPTFRNGNLIVTRKDRRLAWVSTPVAKTPNIYVLTALVGYIRSGVR